MSDYLINIALSFFSFVSNASPLPQSVPSPNIPWSRPFSCIEPALTSVADPKRPVADRIGFPFFFCEVRAG